MNGKEVNLESDEDLRAKITELMGASFRKFVNLVYVRQGKLTTILEPQMNNALGVLWPGYNPVRQYMSELGAVDAPHAFMMNALGFQVSGISTLAFGLGPYRGLSKGWDTVVGMALILLAGVSMVAVGFSPCDPGCINVSPTGVRHATTATIAAIAMTGYSSSRSASEVMSDGESTGYSVQRLLSSP